jgi:xylulokinase
MSPNRAHLLVIDVGTSSVRAAIIDADGDVIAFSAQKHEQHAPCVGWSEQSPLDWWQAVVVVVRQVVASPDSDIKALAGVCVCGQMHSPVPIDVDGHLLTERVQLWNDKRCLPNCLAFARCPDAAALEGRAGNPATPAWTGFKVAWLRDHQAEIYERAATFLTPKDFINFRLTGSRATDYSEASGSFLLNWRHLAYDDAIADALELDRSRFPPIYPAQHVIGGVTHHAAGETALPEGLPVVAGGGDFPVAMLGSGVIEPGLGADIAGTSIIISASARCPVRGPGIGNLCAVSGGWTPFTVLDAGGDSLDWMRRVLDRRKLDFSQLIELACAAPAGSEGLLFLPYLTGERMGEHRNSRGQFFGITRCHDHRHLYRAVIEGVAFASRRNMELLQVAGVGFERIVVSGGGARAPSWLAIKASIYGRALLVPENTETGLLGAAALAGLGVGIYANPAEAVARLVRLRPPVFPEPALVDYYAELYGVFQRLYETSGALCARLDALAARAQGIQPAPHGAGHGDS